MRQLFSDESAEETIIFVMCKHRFKNLIADKKIKQFSVFSQFVQKDFVTSTSNA